MPNTLFPAADQATRARLGAIETLTLLNTFDWSATAVGPLPLWPNLGVWALSAAARDRKRASSIV